MTGGKALRWFQPNVESMYCAHTMAHVNVKAQFSLTRDLSQEKRARCSRRRERVLNSGQYAIREMVQLQLWQIRRSQASGKCSCRESRSKCCEHASGCRYDETLYAFISHAWQLTMCLVESDISAKSFVGKDVVQQTDVVELTAHLLSSFTAQKPDIFVGKIVWCNWDVGGMQAKKAEIEGTLMLTANCIGWPYSP